MIFPARSTLFDAENLNCFNGYYNYHFCCDPDNAQAVHLFGDITAAEMQASLCCVTTLHDQAIRQMIQQAGGSDRLVAKMIARKAWLMKITPD